MAGDPSNDNMMSVTFKFFGFFVDKTSQKPVFFV